MEFTLPQFKEWLEETFPDNRARAIAEANFRDGLSKMADFVFETNSSAFIQEKIAEIISLKATIESSVGGIDDIRIAALGILSQTEEILTATLIAKTGAETAQANANLGQNPLGEYNPVSNLPAITAVPPATLPDTTPVPIGSFLNITEDGILPFAGSNFLANAAVSIGGRLIKKSPTQWYYVKPSDLAIKKVVKIQETLNIDSNSDKIIAADPEGFIFFTASPDGIDYPGRAAELAANAELKEKSKSFIVQADDKVTFCDADGNVFFESSPEGINYPGKTSDGVGAATTVPKGTFLSDYFQIIIYGQSLSVGGSFSSSIDFFDAKTFAGGILTNYDPDTAGAANTYFGANLIDLPTTGIETQGKALSKILKQLIRDENKIPIASQGFTPVVNSCGTGGASYSQLAVTTGDEYRRLLESVRRGKDFALTAGKTYSVPVLSYIQGENTGDRVGTVSEWYAKLETLFNLLNTDIKTITGQTEDVQFIVYQIASNMAAGIGVPLAFLKIAQDKANVHFGCSMYQMTYSDALHVDSNSYRIMGAMMGVVAKRAIVDRIKMQPIGRLTHSIQKNEASSTWVIKMKMNVPIAPLVFDETINSLFTTAPAHKGFVIKNGSNVDIVTNVTISQGDTVNIFCSQNPVGLTLTYAIGGKDSGGNLRDSQGDILTINCAGINKRVDNWCPIFQLTI